MSEEHEERPEQHAPCEGMGCDGCDRTGMVRVTPPEKPKRGKSGPKYGSIEVPKDAFEEKNQWIRADIHRQEVEEADQRGYERGVRETLAPLAERQKQLDEASPDCGDNSCHFAVKKGGMRTNGGCRCLSSRSWTAAPPVEKYAYIARTVLRQLLAPERECPHQWETPDMSYTRCRVCGATPTSQTKNAEREGRDG